MRLPEPAACRSLEALVDCGSCLAGPLVDRLTDAQPKLLVAVPAGPGRPAALHCTPSASAAPYLRLDASPSPEQCIVWCAIYLPLWLSAAARAVGSHGRRRDGQTMRYCGANCSVERREEVVIYRCLSKLASSSLSPMPLLGVCK